MQRRIRQAFTSFKEHTCVSYAKIATIGGFCDIDHTIIKATSPDDVPLLDKYVQEILKIFSISPPSHRAFALSFTRRLGKTKSWRVALKCLVLLHRLLRSTSNDESRLRAELLWMRTNGLLSLYPCNFRDYSSSSFEDYTAFIRSYARLLDEALDCDPIGMIAQERQNHYLDTSDYFSKVSDQDMLEDQESSVQKMKCMGTMIEILPQLQSIIDRAIECRPVGAAAKNLLVQSAIRHIICDSFTCYATFRSEMVVILDNLIQLPYRSCVAAFGIYKKASFQADQLLEFHEWCKKEGYCESYEYPFIDRIPEMQIRALETFLNGMWQLTDQSSSSNISSFTSNVPSPLSSTDADSDKGVNLESRFYQVLNKDIEMEPLIKWEVDNGSTHDIGWEDLLEASINSMCLDSRNNWGSGSCLSETNGWQTQEYNLYSVQSPNPFYEQPNRMNFHFGSCPTTPMHQWDL